MATFTVTRNVDSETLYLPELRPFVGQQVEIVVRASEQNLPARDELLRNLDDTFTKHQMPNWDGADAEAIGPETHEVARRLLSSLPNDVPAPTISAEPDGQLNLEWFRSPRQLLTVSVSGSGTLYWAALIGSEDPRGSCQFVDRFPQTLTYWIGQVYG